MRSCSLLFSAQVGLQEKQMLKTRDVVGETRLSRLDVPGSGEKNLDR